MVHLGCSMWVCTHLLDGEVAFNLPPLLATVCMVASPQWRCHAYCGSLSASLHSSLSVFPGSKAEGWRWSCHPYGSPVVLVTELRWRCHCPPQPSLQLGCTHLVGWLHSSVGDGGMAYRATPPGSQFLPNVSPPSTSLHSSFLLLVASSPCRAGLVRFVEAGTS